MSEGRKQIHTHIHALCCRTRARSLSWIFSTYYVLENISLPRNLQFQYTFWIYSPVGRIYHKRPCEAPRIRFSPHSSRSSTPLCSVCGLRRDSVRALVRLAKYSRLTRPCYSPYFAAGLGLEPRLLVPETSVLPIRRSGKVLTVVRCTHYSAIASGRIKYGRHLGGYSIYGIPTENIKQSYTYSNAQTPTYSIYGKFGMRICITVLPIPYME